MPSLGWHSVPLFPEGVHLEGDSEEACPLHQGHEAPGTSVPHGLAVGDLLSSHLGKGDAKKRVTPNGHWNALHPIGRPTH